MKYLKPQILSLFLIPSIIVQQSWSSSISFISLLLLWGFMHYLSDKKHIQNDEEKRLIKELKDKMDAIQIYLNLKTQ